VFEFWLNPGELAFIRFYPTDLEETIYRPAAIAESFITASNVSTASDQSENL
jgi:hypothetical protein